jgi:hypothetical protein
MIKKKMKKILREPMVHFLVVGSVLFLLFGVTRGPTPEGSQRIVVDAGQVAQLTAHFKRIQKRPPTHTELAELIDNHVRDEVHYREALAMGLDQNDPLIRRRMIQKIESFLVDLSADAEPNEHALKQFLKENPDRFRLEPRISFQQVYLKPDKQGKLQARAVQVLKELRAGAQPKTLGDPTRIARQFNSSPLSFITRSFGDAFAEDLAKLPPGQWAGPLYSTWGGHLVRVAERKESRLPELAEIRAQVKGGYLVQRRQELREIAYQKLRRDYDVVVEPGAISSNLSGTALATELPEEGKP